MNPMFYDYLRAYPILQRLLAPLLLWLGLVCVSAHAATVSVSNYPLFLLSEAVTEGAPSAKRLYKLAKSGITAVSAQ